MPNKLPASNSTALLIIDMINDLDFDEGGDLLAEIDAAVGVIARLREEAQAPTIFVNDNFGQWHADSSQILGYVEGTAGRDVARRLKPRNQDYFVIKPQVSGFYATKLPALLPRLGVNRLVLTGVAADICVLFTAADAHMRECAVGTKGRGCERPPRVSRLGARHHGEEHGYRNPTDHAALVPAVAAECLTIHFIGRGPSPTG